MKRVLIEFGCTISDEPYNEDDFEASNLIEPHVSSPEPHPLLGNLLPATKAPFCPESLKYGKLYTEPVMLGEITLILDYK